MEIKGVSIKSTSEFVKEKFPNKYDIWINTLPEESKKIFTGLVMPTAWYPLKEAFIIPIEKIGELFYDSAKIAAEKSGRYSAEKSLKGIYKIFVKVASPQYVIKRGSNVFSSYYKPARIKASSTSKKSAKVTIYNFSKEEEVIISRVAGWIQRAAEITGESNVRTQISQTSENGDPTYFIDVNWS